MEIADKRVLLTGATGGIGRAIARPWPSGGASSSLSSRKARGARGNWPARSGRRPLGRASPTSPSRARPRSSPPRDAGGPIDVLVANAGAARLGPARATSARGGLARASRVNLEAPMLLAQQLLPAMIERAQRPPRLRLLALRQGGLAAGLGLQRDQVRPPRLRPRPPRGPRRRGRRRRLGRPARLHPRRRHVRRLGGELPPGMGTATREEVGAGVVKAIEREPGRGRSRAVQQRALAGFAARLPRHRRRGSSAAAARRSPTRLARGQTEKRCSAGRRGTHWQILLSSP